MKSFLVKIDHFIPLLTDTLPYEVPFFFSNSGIYRSLKKEYDAYFKGQNVRKARGENNVNVDMSLIDFFTKEYFRENGVLQDLVGKACSSKNAGSIPYEYEIKNTDKGYRNISLIHPAAQIRICDLYKKHKDIILFYCGRSPYSIRYPSKVTSRLVRKHASLLNNIFKESEMVNTSDLREEIKDRGSLSLSEVPSSYFVLEKYGMLHDFYDSFEMLDLEKKFLQCRKIDVKRCFESIYTHSISWAAKDKEYVKGNLHSRKPKSFEDEFDEIMRFSNRNETHGIPIGAETSRLFSEIIFQKIDLNIHERIKTEGELEEGKDFEIRRYMDDFFIFTNDERCSERIQKVCEDELRNYKLFVNESKAISFERPFVMPASSAKQNVRILLSEYLDVFGSRKEGHNASQHSPTYKDMLRVINKIREVIRDHKLSFYGVANIALWSLKKDLLKTLYHIQKLKKTEKMFVSRVYDCLKDFINTASYVFRLSPRSSAMSTMLKDQTQKQKKVEEVFVSRVRGYLRNVIGIAFYVFYLSPRSHTASTIFKIGYIILEILKVINNKELAGEIKQELSYHFLMFCEKISNSRDEKISEFLDIVLFLNELGDNFKVEEDRLKKIFKIETRKSLLSYFEIVVLLSYIKKDSSYDRIRETVLESCSKKLSSKNSLKETENFLLFFDLISCPYLEPDEKEEILKRVGIVSNEKEVILFIETDKKWFFDWEKQENLDLESVLEIKEARLGY